MDQTPSKITVSSILGKGGGDSAYAAQSKVRKQINDNLQHLQILETL
jgi:hypothetical protein